MRSRLSEESNRKERKELKAPENKSPLRSLRSLWFNLSGLGVPGRKAVSGNPRSRLFRFGIKSRSRSSSCSKNSEMANHKERKELKDSKSRSSLRSLRSLRFNPLRQKSLARRSRETKTAFCDTNVQPIASAYSRIRAWTVLCSVGLLMVENGIA